MTIRPNKVRFAIGVYLLSGYLPWGVDFRDEMGTAPALPRCQTDRGYKWILCCGHTLNDRQIAAWRAAGLVMDGPPDKGGRPTVIAGPRLNKWLGDAWHHLVARSWGSPA